MKTGPIFIALIAVSICSAAEKPARPRARQLGIAPGKYAPAALNAITDVPGVRVGHVTVIEDESIRTGVTAIVPHPGNIFQDKLPAAVVVGNGFGKLVGSTQVEELGELETPILLTNTLNVWEAAAAQADYTLTVPGNEAVRSVNPLVGETNDGWLNDIRRRPLKAKHFHEAIERAASGAVAEGNVGAGTGTTTFGFKGGIGTSSRYVPSTAKDYLVGVLVQTNFDGRLTIDGIPVWRELAMPPARETAIRDGSCMIVIATNAPLDSRQLKRLGRRALIGMGRTGANFSHGSGDYALAFSTAETVRIRQPVTSMTREVEVFREDQLTPLFEAVADATEEAIYNALLQATTMRGKDGRTAQAIGINWLGEVLKKYGRNSPEK